MSTPLILKGNLKVNGVDVSAAVTSFTFKGMRETIDIPATFGSSQTFRGGSDTYEVEINYFQNTATPTHMTGVFWDALADADGTVTVEGSFNTGAVSATNPKWTGTALVTGVGLGGDVNTLAVDSQTFPLLGRPVKANS